MDTCKSCNNKRSSDYYKELKTNNLIEYQLRQRSSELTRRAKLKKLPYEKKMFKVLMELWNHQNGLCFYTKEKMDLDGFSTDNPRCFVVDRLIPENGYTKENMVFCCNAVNRIKSSFTIEELKWWVNKII